MNRYSKLALASLGVFSLNLAIAQDPNYDGGMEDSMGPGMDPQMIDMIMQRMDDMERRMNEQGGGNPDMEQMMMERIDMLERMAMERMDGMEQRFDETMQ